VSSVERTMVGATWTHRVLDLTRRQNDHNPKFLDVIDTDTEEGKKLVEMKKLLNNDVCSNLFLSMCCLSHATAEP
jgi:hypothetical protein